MIMAIICMIALIIIAYVLIGVVFGSALCVFGDAEGEIATIGGIFWPIVIPLALLIGLANYVVIPLMEIVADKIDDWLDSKEEE